MSTESENSIETRDNRMDVAVEVAKSPRGEGFDDMNAQDIRKLLLQEETDEGGLAETIPEIQDNSDNDNLGQKVYSTKYKERPRLRRTVRVVFPFS